jgi:hypothetical protein
MQESRRDEARACRGGKMVDGEAREQEGEAREQEGRQGAGELAREKGEAGE